MKQKGVSIIGAVFTLLILAAFGTAIVVLVATDQEVRRRHIEKEQAFYASQAGLEYAIREINQGGYPVMTNKPIGRGQFTTTIDYPTHMVQSTGISGDVSKTYKITYNPMGGDCLTINGNITVGGVGSTDVGNIVLSKTCLTAITVDKIQLSWSPNGGQKVTRIEIDGNVVYNNPAGSVSGTIIDVADYMISDSNNHIINLIRFTSDMRNKQITITVFLTDTSYRSQNFTTPS